MPRSVNSVAAKARRKKILKAAKGYFGRRKNVWTIAKNAVEKGLQYAYRDRRTKKRNFRALWIMRINAAARLHGMTYSQLINKLKSNNIEINRKVLADSIRIIDTNISKDNPFYKPITESAVRTFFNPECNPLKLPKDKYDLWKNLTINFDLRLMKVYKN